MVEDRIHKWPLPKLTKEGFTMLNLSVHPKGNLFQEKVFRFSSRDLKLPYHQFSVGDSVRITTSFGDPLSEASIDGVLLDRRPRYLDICLNNADAVRIDTTMKYRLDCMVNRVTYDRQIEALQSFLTPTAPDVIGISRAVRDIMLYSYPNSMIQLANTPGGLKMALPLTDTTSSPELNMGSAQSRDLDGMKSDDEENLIVSAALNKGREMIGMTSKKEMDVMNEMEDMTDMTQENAKNAKNEKGGMREVATTSVRGRGNEEDNPEVESLIEKFVPPMQQLQQPVTMKYSKKIFEDVSSSSSSGGSGAGSSGGWDRRRNDSSSTLQPSIVTTSLTSSPSTSSSSLSSSSSVSSSVTSSLSSSVSSSSLDSVESSSSFTVAEALSSLKTTVKSPLGDIENYQVDATPITMSEAVFTTNSRLRSMAETFTPTANTKLPPYSEEEVNRAVATVSSKCSMNPSQLLALRKAVTQTVTLVQGPPGTGKTRTACAMLSVVVALKDQRLVAGGEQSQGLRAQR